jgi:signal transduction histidine kinase
MLRQLGVSCRAHHCRAPRCRCGCDARCCERAAAGATRAAASARLRADPRARRVVAAVSQRVAPLLDDVTEAVLEQFSAEVAELPQVRRRRRRERNWRGPWRRVHHAVVCDVSARRGGDVCARARVCCLQVAVRGDATLACVPWSVQFAVGELLKNAVQASCARSASAPPPVAVHVSAESRGLLTIAVTDGGAGLDEHALRHALAFGWSSTPDAAAAPDSRQAMRSRRQLAPLAGLGVGLPLARTHARLMGGELELASSDAGTEARLVLPTDGAGVVGV